MATTVVHRISIADADDYDTIVATLAAALPAYGANFSYATLNGAGLYCIGSIDRGDDADIDSDTVSVKPIHEGVKVMPAGSLTAQRYITRHNGIEEVTFKAYDVTQEVFELDSNVGGESNYSLRTSTQTNRCMFIEYDGIRIDAYPNIVLSVVSEDGGFGPGDKAVNIYGFKAMVLGTTDIPSGQIKYHYEVAT